MSKKAMITGASEGIGREFTLQLAQQGYEVTGVARNENKLRALAASVGGDMTVLVADLSTPNGQQTVVDELGRTHYDLLINNAGVGLTAPFAAASLPATLSMMHLNCDAVVVLAHAFLAQAKAGDALLNVASTLAFLPCATSGVYAATKSFVVAFTEALWFEQRRRGVFVQCVCPGVTSTDFHAHSGGRAEDIPRAAFQSPTEVVVESLRALAARRQPTVITGWKNRLAALLTRVLSRKATATLMSHAMTSRPPRTGSA
jgi:uncharacterized protein